MTSMQVMQVQLNCEEAVGQVTYSGGDINQILNLHYLNKNSIFDLIVYDPKGGILFTMRRCAHRKKFDEAITE